MLILRKKREKFSNLVKNLILQKLQLEQLLLKKRFINDAIQSFLQLLNFTSVFYSLRINKLI